MPSSKMHLLVAKNAIAAFCEGRVPERVRDQVRLDVVSDGNTITIVERRAPRDPALGAQWSSVGVARFRYLPRLGKWRLFWSDRNGRWRSYDLVPPPADIGPLLEEVELDPTSIFWG